MLEKLMIDAALLALSAGAAAQSAAPSGFTLTPYLWSAGFTGTIGASDSGGRVNADFSGLADSMEISGFMLRADWRRDRCSVFGDGSTVKVTSSAPSPLGALYAGVDGEIRGNILQAAVGYRVLCDAASGIDAFAGLRYYDIEVQLDLRAGTPVRAQPGRFSELGGRHCRCALARPILAQLGGQSLWGYRRRRLGCNVAGDGDYRLRIPRGIAPRRLAASRGRLQQQRRQDRCCFKRPAAGSKLPFLSIGVIETIACKYKPA